MAADPIVAETKRIFDELTEAKKGVVGNRAPDPLKKARNDRAMAAAYQHRKMLRQIGQFVGNRPFPTPEQLVALADENKGPDDVLGIRTADNEDNPPTLEAS